MSRGRGAHITAMTQALQKSGWARTKNNTYFAVIGEL